MVFELTYQYHQGVFKPLEIMYIPESSTIANILNNHTLIDSVPKDSI